MGERLPRPRLPRGLRSLPRWGRALGSGRRGEAGGNPNTPAAKKWPTRGQPGVLQRVKTIFHLENIFFVCLGFFCAKSRPSVHSHRPLEKQTPAQLFFPNSSKLGVSGNKRARERSRLHEGFCRTHRPLCTPRPATSVPVYPRCGVSPFPHRWKCFAALKMRI